jgi:hypothetical protein
MKLAIKELCEKAFVPHTELSSLVPLQNKISEALQEISAEWEKAGKEPKTDTGRSLKTRADFVGDLVHLQAALICVQSQIILLLTEVE